MLDVVGAKLDGDLAFSNKLDFERVVFRRWLAGITTAGIQRTFVGFHELAVGELLCGAGLDEPVAVILRLELEDFIVGDHGCVGGDFRSALARHVLANLDRLEGDLRPRVLHDEPLVWTGRRLCRALDRRFWVENRDVMARLGALERNLVALEVNGEVRRVIAVAEGAIRVEESAVFGLELDGSDVRNDVDGRVTSPWEVLLALDDWAATAFCQSPVFSGEDGQVGGYGVVGVRGQLVIYEQREIA